MFSGNFSYVRYLSLVIFISLLFIRCGEDKDKTKVTGADTQLTTVQATNELSKYISGFSSGEVSKASSILIQFADDVVSEDEIGEEISDPPINFDPELDGTAKWRDKRTLEFKPDEFLEPATHYTCKIKLKDLFKNVTEEFETVQFQFYAVPTSLSIDISPLKSQSAQNLEMQKLEGTLTSSDYESPEEIEKIVKVYYVNSVRNIIWSHSDDGRTHKFIVENIKRENNAKVLSVVWDATKLDIDFRGQKRLIVPRLSDFKFLFATAESKDERSVTLNFSDPLKEGQDLNGLIRIENVDLKFVIDGNIVHAYPANAKSYLSGKMFVYVEKGIENSAGDKIPERTKAEIEFKEINPQLQLVGKGTIAPLSGKVLFPFKSVNIEFVDVQIVKIFEKNIPQFLQVNSLSGTGQLNRVAQVISEKTIYLDTTGVLNLSKWNNFSLDLSKLASLDPGSIYRVSIGFRQSSSLYPGARDKNDEFEDGDRSPFRKINQYSDSYWDEYENDGWNDWQYSWKDRENPRHKTYYGPSKTISRNIIASDLGIIAKGSEDGNMFFVVTDLNNAKPLSNVTLDIYDYQNRQLKSTSTNSDGMAKISLKDKPFLLVAKKDKQRGYLKLLDGNAISLSKFDISGKDLRKGVKGFIYGERGVWRPGDEIFLTFILDDRNKTLPENHPVSFELNDPRGQLVKRIVSKKSMDGFYSFHVKTSADAPTGNYNAVVKVGGSVFSKSLSVETIMPNRLRINLDLKKEIISKKDLPFDAELETEWLHGAIAKNLKTTVTASLSTIRTTFDNYKTYFFDNPTLRYNTETETIFDGKVDEYGKAKIPIKFEMNENAPGRLQAKLLCKVFEPGGAFSRDFYTLKYNAYDYYVGIRVPKGDKRNMLVTDKDHIVDIITLTADGKPVSRKNVTVKVYKISWRWWWDNTQDNLTNYNSREIKNFVTKTTVNTNSQGKGTAILRINRPNWGRFLVVAEDPDGHSVAKTVYIDWPGWARKSTDQEGASMLTFTADKDSYKVGDEITLQIPGCENGRALISLESGSKVIDAYWAETNGGTIKFPFEATPEMAPNVFAHVTLLQPHAQITNDLPIRLYGVIPISVEDPETHITPVINMPDVLRPNQSFEVKVSEAEGKEMTYTLAVVDEGLLDLTKYKTPDPWNDFYSREALKVKTWDIYDEVIGYNGREFDVLLSMGGGDEGEGDEGGKINRFKPVVKFLGPFHLDSDETANHKIEMPMYIGSVKTMVVAGYEGAYGKAEKATPVKKPLMMIGTLPRVLGPNEEMEFYLSVFADESIKDVDITVNTNDLIEITGNKTQHITFSEPGDQLVGFPIKVKSKIGKASVSAKAKSGSETAEYNFDIEIRNPNTYTTESEVKVLPVNETWNFEKSPFGIPGTNSGTLEVSSLPPLNLNKRLDFLIRYPHGCIEQTTSSVFPQLYLGNLVELTTEQKEDIDINIKNGIERIKHFQLTDGSLSYWPGGTYASLWGTNYGGHFMLEAEKLGYSLPIGFKSKWVTFQLKEADKWDMSIEHSDLIQAYRLFLLAFSGNPLYGAMNRFREEDRKCNTSSWMLAAAYYLAGQKEAAKSIASNLTVQVDDYRELTYTYGSSLRDKAIILYCMNLMKYNENASFLLAKNISERLSSRRWWSTQTVGYSLLSMGQFYNNLDSKLLFRYTLNGETPLNIDKETPIEEVDLNVKAGKPVKLSVKNTGKNSLYLVTSMKGIPQIGEEKDAENNITLSVNYKDLEGNEINVDNLAHGTDFYTEVRVYNPGLLGNYSELALTQIFPSGWEILNNRQLSESSQKYDRPDYQDVRDDRVYTYFSLPAKHSKTFKIMLNASYRGKFYMPAVHVEAMYDETISAQKKGKWVNVIKK